MKTNIKIAIFIFLFLSNNSFLKAQFNVNSNEKRNTLKIENLKGKVKSVKVVLYEKCEGVDRMVKQEENY